MRKDTKDRLKRCERRWGIRFRKRTNLLVALSHRSYANEGNRSRPNNERLEFLGDSVLGLVVAEYLYTRYPDNPEGDLARIKSYVVSEDSLAEVARRIDLNDAVLLGRGERSSGGRDKKAILSDALEAVIGAYYLDRGFRAARRFVRRLLVPQVDSVEENAHRRDYKSLLQHLVQQRFHNYPRYNVDRKSGPDHARTYWISVEVDGKTYGPQAGRSKKDAERMAAREAYDSLSDGYVSRER